MKKGEGNVVDEREASWLRRRTVSQLQQQEHTYTSRHQLSPLLALSPSPPLLPTDVKPSH
jgi:hypothetical protein